MGDPGSGSTITAKLNRLARRRSAQPDSDWRSAIADEIRDSLDSESTFDSLVSNEIDGTTLAATQAEVDHLIGPNDFRPAMKQFILDTIAEILAQNAPATYELEYGSAEPPDFYDMKYSVNSKGEYTVTFRAPNAFIP